MAYTRFDYSSIERVDGAILANIVMGVVGALGGMATYALAGGIAGNLTGSGFIAAAAGGFVTGSGGFTPVSAQAGAAVTGVVNAALDDE
jgi:hypothetical protein